MKKINEHEIHSELSKFKHIISGQVKFHEVDAVRVIHNIQYLYYCEWARTKYLEYIGCEYNKNTFISEIPLMTVHNEIDYFSSGHLSDYYEVLTRTSQIRNSSIVLNNLIRLKNGEILAKASSTLVYLDLENYRPMRIPENFREMIIGIEGNNVEIIEK
jgi:acyl-CoA thioester hydrolase